MNILGKKGRLLIAEHEGTVYLSGFIDIESDFSVLLETDYDLLKISLKGIEKVNSHGILKFLQFVNDLGSKRFELHECPLEMVEIINMVPAILGDGRGRVKSFYSVYVCHECDKEVPVLCRPEEFQMVDDEIVPPYRECPIHSEMEFDDDLEEFIHLISTNSRS